MSRKHIIIGNWKMYKNIEDTKSFLNQFGKLIKGKDIKCDYGIAASYTNLSALKLNQPNNLIIVAQNCHFETQGAFTGEVSIEMLKDIAVSHVVIGHSERRMYFNETNESINKKLHALFSTNMVPILCCGESDAEYEAKKTKDVIKKQISLALTNIKTEYVHKLVIAYEPIWAIGTGKTASASEAQTVCKMIRDYIAKLYDENTAQKVRIQYGGSVKPENIKTFLDQTDIDGALVGGASLQPESFLGLLV